ncbi:MAG: DNA-directed RNA polymerase subunit alpha [Armatimonadetes bacterium]|nr:DNA-directed RNA polymerase subunit alpha [Armatimonadota bacterium]
MLEALKPAIHPLQVTETYGKFVAEPLERGFGHTLGNAFRRVLMSHIPGAAITAVRIEGARHEFTTLPGVYEDTTEIILNIKELAIRIHDEVEHAAGERRVMRLDARGEGEVTGAQIMCPGGVEIVNPDLVIARLTEPKASLAIEMWVEVGQGYLAIEDRDREKRSADMIPVDATFSPVTRVSYRVEPTRLGHRTDLDRLVLEVWGDGTLEPKAAVARAADILLAYVGIFTEKRLVAATPEEAPEPEPEVSGLLQAPIENLDFSVRTYNCLKKEKIDTLGILVEQTEEDLLAIRNFGKRSLQEVIDKLADMDLALKTSATGQEFGAGEMPLGDAEE